jgi:hypothetical protein
MLPVMNPSYSESPLKVAVRRPAMVVLLPVLARRLWLHSSAGCCLAEHRSQCYAQRCS